MNKIEDIKERHASFLKQIEKQIGQKLPSLTIPEDSNSSLNQAQKKLEAAINAKEAAIHR